MRPLGYLGFKTQIFFCIRPGVITRLYGKLNLKTWSKSAIFGSQIPLDPPRKKSFPT